MLCIQKKLMTSACIEFSLSIKIIYVKLYFSTNVDSCKCAYIYISTYLTLIRNFRKKIVYTEKGITYVELWLLICWKEFTKCGWMLCGQLKISVCQSVHPIFRPSVRTRSLVRYTSSHTLTQSGVYLTHRVPFGKECAVTLNHVSRCKVTVKEELYE